MTRAAAVVIGRNEGPRLPRCLRSVLGHFHPIVYVDSASSDGSREVAAALGADVVELDLSTPFTFGRARNAGAARVRALAPDVPYLQFVDADSEVGASWAGQAIAALEAAPAIAAVHGRVRERFARQSLYDRLYELEFDPRSERSDVFGGMAMLRVAAFDAVGRYPEHLSTFEDHELSFRFRSAGWQILRLDADMVIHEAGMTRWRDWWRRERRAGRGRAELMRLHGWLGDPCWRRAYASIWWWGGLLPLAVIVAAVTAPSAAIVACLAYAGLLSRIMVRMRRDGFAIADAALYAAGRVFAKVPQLHGVLSEVAASAASRAPSIAAASRVPGEAVRVAYLINQYPKVTHTFVRTEIAALERAGVVVERVAIRAAAALLDPADGAEAAKTRVLVGGNPLRLAGAAVAAAGAHPSRALRALAAALRLGWRSERGVARHLAYWVEACLLLSWLRAGGIHHLHATFGANPAAVALLCRVLGGPPYSFTAHGPEEFERAALLGIAEKVRHAAFVVVVSEAGRVHLEQCCPPADWSRIHVVRCGVDARFRAGPRTPVPVDRRLVFVGRLCAEKAPLLLLETIARLRDAGDHCELVMVGDGPLRGAVEARIQARGLSGSVTLTGWADGDAVRRWILSARALVLPSFAEGVPVVLMEALALGRPVVCTAVGGVSELVESGVCGWVVPPGSPAALASALAAVLNAPPAVLEMLGRNGAERVAQRHDPDRAARALAALFAGSRPGPAAA